MEKEENTIRRRTQDTEKIRSCGGSERTNQCRGRKERVNGCSCPRTNGHPVLFDAMGKVKYSNEDRKKTKNRRRFEATGGE